MPKLYELTDEYQAVLDAIEANGGELDDSLLARFEAVAADWQDKIGACAAMADHLALMSGAFREVAERKRRLGSAYAGSAERLKNYIVANMEAMGSTKVEAGEVRVRLCASPASSEAVDESQTPDAYLIVQAPKADRRGILAALKDGVAVAGWRLVTGRHHVRID